MSDAVFSTIPVDYYKSNEKIYPRNGFCCKISNMSNFDPKGFSEWMKSGYGYILRLFPKITYIEIAKEVGSNPATITRLMGGKPQWNGTFSKPRPEVVKELARFFNKDVNEGLLLAGHVHTESPKTIEIEVNDDLGIIIYGESKYTNKTLNLMKDILRRLAIEDGDNNNGTGGGDDYENAEIIRPPDGKPIITLVEGQKFKDSIEEKTNNDPDNED